MYYCVVHVPPVVIHCRPLSQFVIYIRYFSLICVVIIVYSAFFHATGVRVPCVVCKLMLHSAGFKSEFLEFKRIFSLLLGYVAVRGYWNVCTRVYM